jgi:hypothetical protein
MTERDLSEVFMFRFEGGPHDGATQPSPITSPDELPPLIECDPSGARYELATFSRVPPHPRLVRGAIYRYVGS